MRAISASETRTMPAIILGVVGGMIARHSTARGVWRTILGFGLLFFGMNLMSHELKGIAKLPELIAFFSRFDCTPTASGYLPMESVLGGIAVGTLCTMLVQSSSAMIGNVIDIPVLTSLYDIARHLTNIAKRVKA